MLDWIEWTKKKLKKKLKRSNCLNIIHTSVIEEKSHYIVMYQWEYQHHKNMNRMKSEFEWNNEVCFGQGLCKMANHFFSNIAKSKKKKKIRGKKNETWLKHTSPANLCQIPRILHDKPMLSVFLGPLCWTVKENMWHLFHTYCRCVLPNCNELAASQKKDRGHCARLNTNNT